MRTGGQADGREKGGSLDRQKQKHKQKAWLVPQSKSNRSPSTMALAATA